MKKYYQINDEIFRCEPQARHRFDEIKLDIRTRNVTIRHVPLVELWEISEYQDIFGNIKKVKTLVTRYTQGLPDNGVYRICDTCDVRRAKKMYSMQKYDAENHCWKNFKLGDDLDTLIKFMKEFSEVLE